MSCAPSAIPRATCRLQLTPQFPFAAAERVIPYLAELGVSHLYLSPIFEARAGSEHGYDITDPTRVRAELGGERGFRALVAAARSHDLGVVLDIVPNHMAADAANRWWWETLELGRESPFSDYFDIHWSSGPDGRVVLPVLGRSLDEALDFGEIQIDRGSPHDPDEPVLRYFDKRFPLHPGTIEMADRVGERLASPAALWGILDGQRYVLMHWRDGLKVINYRRFFDISDLVVVRIQDEAVFNATHALIRQLLNDGLVDGLRIDHIDGLHDPQEYLARLRRLINESAAPARNRNDGFYVIVEKILARGETLPAGWPVQGTTGYDFMNEVNRLFVDPIGHRRLIADAERRAGLESPRHTVFHAKADVFTTLFPADLKRLTDVVERLAASSFASGERPARGDLERAIVDLTAGLGVYRTYIRDGSAAGESDRERINEACAAAAAAGAELRGTITTSEHSALQFVRALLLGESPADRSELANDRRSFIDEWQRITGPVMAKGYEDTALYRSIALASVNEVGGGLEPIDDAVERFHAANIRRAQRSPHTMNATATHDNKRGEDTRLRMNTISCIDDWPALLDRWMERHESIRAVTPRGPAPEPSDEMLIYQSAFGLWPIGEAPGTSEAPRLADRLSAYMTKAAREAKRRTSWHAPDQEYEMGVGRFVQSLLLGERQELFRREMTALAEREAFAAVLHSLAQVVLRITSPGLPDLYRGAEFCDLSLVDPDNRQPVDFDPRAAALSELRSRSFDRSNEPLIDLWRQTWWDGRLKLLVTALALDARRRFIDVFELGDYVALEIIGHCADHALAFQRRRGEQRIIVVVGRLLSPLIDADREALPPDAWNGTAVRLLGEPDGEWREIISGRTIRARADRSLLLTDALEKLPVAILVASAR